MKMEQLQYFLEIARSNSIRQSSEKLNISHQGLSSSLGALEKELGYTLFMRNHQGIFLTENGQTAVEIAQKIQVLYEEMLAIPAQDSAAPTHELQGRLSIMAAPFMNARLSVTVLKEFIRRYPQVNMRTKIQETSEMLQNLAENPADIYFTVSFFPERLTANIDCQQFLYQELAKDMLYLIAATFHPLARYRSVSISTILKYPFAVFQAGDQNENPLYEIFPETSSPRVVLRTDHMETLLTAVREGNAVITMPYGNLIRHLSFDKHEQVVCIPVHNIPQVTFGYIINKHTNTAKRELIDRFIALVREYF